MEHFRELESMILMDLFQIEMVYVYMVPCGW